MDAVKPIVIKRTQDSLSKFVKKPPLTEKLLKKPPFRFLHDLIMAVVRQHGLLEGLFSPEEMNSENVKDKESKIVFLQKVIDTVKLMTGSQLTVRPAKIVAGQEPEKTNELLQAIGKALEKKMDSKSAVQQVLGKGTLGNNKDKTEPAANEKASSKVRTSKSDKPERRDASLARKKERKTKEPETPKSIPQVPPPVAEVVGVEPEEAPLSLGAPEEPISLLPAAEIVDQPAPEETPAPEVTQEEGEMDSSPLVLGTSDILSQSTDENAPRPVAAPSPSAPRPGSAKPRPITARPAAPRIRETRVVRPARELDTPTEPAINNSNNSNLILESPASAQAPHDEDDNFTVEEVAPVPVENLEVLQQPTLPLNDLGQGHLVEQILGTQKQLQEVDGDSAAPRDADWQAREVSRGEVQTLREEVQKVARAAHPLGRLLDFLQEDVEAMTSELETWRGEREGLRRELAREQRVTEESLQPLEVELADLTSKIEQQKQMTSALKAAVRSHEAKLRKILISP